MPSSTSHVFSLSLAALCLAAFAPGCIASPESTDDTVPREDVAAAEEGVTNGNVQMPTSWMHAMVKIPSCSATRIGTRMLITAAHCVLYQNTGTIVPNYRPGGTFSISWTKTLSPGVEVVTSATVRTLATYVHPGWNWQLAVTPDVALIELDPNTAGFTTFSNGTSFKSVNVGYTPYDGRSLIMGGWGYSTASGSGPSGLPLFGATNVNLTNTNYIKVIDTAVDPSHAGMTHGDSGGPMFDNEGGWGGNWGEVVAIHSVLNADNPYVASKESWHVRLDAWEVRDWLLGFAAKVSINRKSKIRGYIDGTTISNGTRYVYGWACDWGVGQSVDVHLYVNGAFAGAGTANQPTEVGVSNLCGTGGVPHRFSIPIGSGFAGQPVYAYGISKSGGVNLPLDHSGWFNVP